LSLPFLRAESRRRRWRKLRLVLAPTRGGDGTSCQSCGYGPGRTGNLVYTLWSSTFVRRLTTLFPCRNRSPHQRRHQPINSTSRTMVKAANAAIPKPQSRRRTRYTAASTTSRGEFMRVALCAVLTLGLALRPAAAEPDRAGTAFWKTVQATCNATAAKPAGAL